MGKPKEQKPVRSKLSVFLPTDLHDKVKHAAIEDGVSGTVFIERLVAQRFAAKKKAA